MTEVHLSYTNTQTNLGGRRTEIIWTEGVDEVTSNQGLRKFHYTKTFKAKI